jgi:hypothetical protein
VETKEKFVDEQCSDSSVKKEEKKRERNAPPGLD